MAPNVRQYKKAVTGSRRKKLLMASAAALSAAILIVTGIYLHVRPYRPPKFDTAAAAGVPDVPEGLGFGYAGTPDGNSFRVGLASRWKREPDGSLPVWFTNPEGNDAYLLLRITNEDGRKIFYETGLVRPGEYVEKLAPVRKLPEDDMPVTAAVYSLDPENYHSLGTFRLSGTVQ